MVLEKIIFIFYLSLSFFHPRCSYQTTLLQFSLPPGLHFRSRQTPENGKVLCLFVPFIAATLLGVCVVGLNQSNPWFLYLLPGVEDHDIIGGEVVLGYLPGYLLNLKGREGLSGAVLMYCVHQRLWSVQSRYMCFLFSLFFLVKALTVTSGDYPK